MERKEQNIEKVFLGISSNEDILGWSSGEVTKPETINYKTHKPEANGLFDETIFGPTKDYRCPLCGKKHKRADAGKPCIGCGESVIESKMVRRRKMGHIKLNAPVAHIWFSRVDYSVIRTILGMKQEEVESLLYFQSHIIYDAAGHKDIKEGTLIRANNGPSIYRDILTSIMEKETNSEVKELIQMKIDKLLEETQSDIGQNYGIDFYDYNNFIAKFSDVRIGTGAETIRILLENISLKRERNKLLKRLEESEAKDNSQITRRIKVFESFIKSGQKPQDMIMDVVPVIPADLRPLIQLDGGRHSTVDINELYRRVIIRNNRLKQWQSIGAPDLIVQNEKRMLQESVDALFDNARKKIPVNSKDNRPLKSLAENLKGKQGRFRQNLLGKRVDYSGRSVIVVGPELELHQVGLPKQMVVKLFEPFIVNLLVEEGVTRNIKQAKKLIEEYDDRIWKYAARVIKGHPVLLNRAPTLHRLSIQAFEPIITSGKAIRLHPLVTPAFNADFDGDQMAVHVPLSKAAKAEARELMLSSTNVLGPKDGKLILSPSQDIVLGIYYLTKINQETILKVFGSFDELDNAINMKTTHIHDIVAVPMKIFGTKFKKEMKDGYKFILSTVGRILINKELPEEYIFVNEVTDSSLKSVPVDYMAKAGELDSKFKAIALAKVEYGPFKKGNISKLIETVFEQFPEEISRVLDAVKNLGFKYSMISGASMAMSDIVEIEKKDEIIAEADKLVSQLQEKTDEGLLTDDQRYEAVLKVWANAREEVKEELSRILEEQPDNPLYMMMTSGARGNISNFVQLAGLRGSMAKAVQEYAALKRQGIITRATEEIPVKSSFKSGLTPFEYFLSTHGARKGLSDTATKTADSGYLTRRLVDAVQDVMITEDDCKDKKGHMVKAIRDTRTGAVIEPLWERIAGRVSVEEVKSGNKILVRAGELITEETAKQIQDAEIKSINIRSVLTCKTHRGLCSTCFGTDLTTGDLVDKGEAVGIISAQSIGEPGTQLTMRTFHTGGVAGVSDITQGFSRLVEIVDANRNPKSAAVISTVEGVVAAIETHKTNSYGQPLELKVVIETPKGKSVELIVDTASLLRVKQGQSIRPGQKITEGSVRTQELLSVAGQEETQVYIIKEMQKLYRLQGINISDKYMEVIVRQMLSKNKVTDSGETDLFVSQIVSNDQLKEANDKAKAEGKKAAKVEKIILGVKAVPLQSESFLAAASYQRTAEALVNASISGRTDELFGVKESLIVGNQIPVGTGLANPQGKYDIDLGTDIDENEYYENRESMEIELEITEQDEIRVVNELNK